MPTEEQFRDAARNLYGSDDVEIDCDATVSVSDDGAFVQGWVWVGNTDADPAYQEEDNA